jgi:hypothetical protein
MKKVFRTVLAFALVLTMAFGFGAFVQAETDIPEEGVTVTIAPEAAPANTLKYSDYGAAGDGVTDDFEAIIATHEAANAADLPVAADAGAEYYIGDSPKTAIIQTSCYWGDARFIFDDTEVIENRAVRQFKVTSKQEPIEITTVDEIAKGQETIELGLDMDVLVIAFDANTTRFIRNGSGLTNDGESQRDMFLVDAQGHVDPNTPVLWEYEHVTSMTAYPIDKEPLYLNGGQFTTLAGQALSKDIGYYYRAFHITRSNVMIDSMYHDVENESGNDVRYSGFLYIDRTANVTVQNSMFSGRAAGGNSSYDLVIDFSSYTLFKNCKQINTILNENGQRDLWGIMASNYVKNLVYDTVEFSRYDSHKGVHNATIRNSIIGYQGLALIGSGTVLVENTKVTSYEFINFRSDYGSSWEGDVIIKNCVYVPYNGPVKHSPVVINGYNNGTHWYGYQSYMPRTVTIDGLYIDDSNSGFYAFPRLFGEYKYFGEILKGIFVKENYPIIATEEVRVKDIEVKSGRCCIKSYNFPVFWKTKVIKH